MKKVRVLASVLALGTLAVAGAQSSSITADFSAEKTPVSKNLYGIFYEDINYAADGGLYGEMVQNRSFEFAKCRMRPTEKWSDLNKNGGRSKSKLKFGKTNPLNENNITYATITLKQEGDGFANQGYSGMPLTAGKKNKGSLYLRSTDGSVTSVTVMVGEKADKAWSTTFEITSEWKKYEFEAEPVASTNKGQIMIFPDQVGTLDCDFVSLFRSDIYRDEPNGLRKDLAERLEALKPAFVRFPGGCIVHGMDLENRYQWKDTIGPVEQRKEKMNFWGYQQSYGIGFYEYFRFCEDIGAEPLPVISVGMAHNGEISEAKDYIKYAQDALDLIEWATGSADSKWGKLRAEAGHPEPFKLNYIGIGNEDCGKDYFQRFEFISSRIKKQYPEIKTIISSGWTYNNVDFHNTWNQARSWEGNKKKNNLVDLIDEHYYNESVWFLANGNRYDDKEFYKRGEGQPKVFIGEYASWVDGRRNNLYSALTEAAYMCSIERNGDVVELSSYAPLFAKEGNTQWAPDMIWFNNTTSYATPDYYVQQLFSTNKTDYTVKTEVAQPPRQEKKKVIGGTVGLGTWATTAQFKDIKVTDNDTGKVIYEVTKSSDLEDFRLETGDWTKSSNTIIQKSNDICVRSVLDNEAAVENVQNYTYELKAMKQSGAEGFLILFGCVGKKLYWWNMGGWGNTQSCVEKGTADGRTILGDSKPLTLTNGQWYNIKIEVTGESYKCYLDGKLMHEYTEVMNFDSLYAHVGETEDGRIIAKIVNIEEKPLDIKINLKGVEVADTAKETVLTSTTRTDENSFVNPEYVKPVTNKIKASSDFTYTAKPGSVTVLEFVKK